MQSRISVRTKSRIFKAIRLFAHSHILRTNALKFLQRTIDRHNKTRGMLFWKTFTRRTREETLLFEEAHLVKDLDASQQRVSAI